MTAYTDTNGNEWDNADDALTEFLSDLPALTEEETEMVFQFTHFQADAATNLRAIAYGVTYAGLDNRFGGDNYPIPVPAITLDDATISQLFEELIWQATDYEGTPLDYLNFERDDIPQNQQETLVEEFRQFCLDNASDIRDFMSVTGTTLGQVAHDYILTRNGHGAGFWDRGAGDVGERLSDACKPWGGIEVYISDNGTLEIS